MAYLITAYFDDRSDVRLKRLIDGVAKASGNRFMTEHQVPAHLTIAQLEARNPGILEASFYRLCESCFAGTVSFAGIIVLPPYVLSIGAVRNPYLSEVNEKACRYFMELPEVSISRFYQHENFYPHITMGKTLSDEEMFQGFSYLKKHYAPFAGEIRSLGLSKVNPHEDLIRVNLAEMK